jgi:hypothetical protein
VIGPSNPIVAAHVALLLLELLADALALVLLLLLLLLPQPTTNSAAATIAAMRVRPFTALTSSWGERSRSWS